MTNKKRKILKYIRKHPNCKTIYKKFKVTDDTYMDFNTSIWDYVTFNNDSYDETTKVALNDFGIELLEERFTDNFRFWIPLTIADLISIAALIVAILAYVKQ